MVFDQMTSTAFNTSPLSLPPCRSVADSFTANPAFFYPPTMSNFSLAPELNGPSTADRTRFQVGAFPMIGANQTNNGQLNNFSGLRMPGHQSDLDEGPVALPSTSQHQINDPCAHLIQVLLCYHQGGEDPEFIRKAIESLVKKLKDKRAELDSLISAVTSGGKQATSCVTIHRSLDGRLQVAGRKGVPHVVYARIWRWPNVSKNELQKLAICTTPSDHPDLICINPFHYDRIVSSTINIGNMNSLRMDALSNAADSMDTPGLEPELSFPHSNCSVPNSAIPSTTTSFDFTEPSSSASNQPFLIYGPHQQPSYVVSHLPCGGTISSTALPSSLQQETPLAHVLRMKTDESQGWLPVPQPASTVTSEYALEASIPPNHVVFATNNDGKAAQNIFGVKRYDSLRYNLDRVQIPLTNLTQHWCSISYYELDTQIGQTFKVPRDQSEVVVDGGMNPAGAKSGRFCLGALPNVHRSEASEKARIHIGRGVRLRCTPQGSVYLHCLSLKGVFVRSYYLDFEHGLIYGSTVHKFCVGSEKKIFDLRWAFAEMCEQRQSAQIAVAAQACAVAGITQNVVAPSVIERAGTGVDDLRRVCCTIAISFVKGWGAGYNRSTIKETPCWIELQLHKPLQLLNGLLRKTD
ncbi:Mothers against decapentaplegic-like protein [Aphelenchoides besseyi]|nr:Mothers against decapentaplegic-like protein [Aphelenchoides besseyi]